MPQLPPPPLQLRKRAIILMGASAGFVVLICVTVAFILSSSRTDALRQAEQKLEISSLGLQHTIDRTIESLDLSLQATRNGLATPGLASLDPSVRSAILFGGAIGISGVVGVVTTDEHGDVVYSYKKQSRQANLADRPYFRAHAEHPDLGLLIGDPIKISSTGNPGITITRRVNHPDGTFAGVVVGALDLTYFDQLFSRLAVGPESVITLRTASGAVIARWPHVIEGPGAVAGRSTIMGLISTAPSGFLTTASPSDHVERLYAYSRFSEYPLILTVAMPTREVFSDWYRRSVLLGGIVIALAACSAMLSWFVWHELQRRIQAEWHSTCAERTAKAALMRMETLFSASHDSMLIVRVEPNGDYVYEAVNPVWESMTGVPAADAIGRRPEDILPQAIAQLKISKWQQSIATQSFVHFAFDSPKLGDPRMWESLIVPVVSHDGHVRRIISVERDVTERNHAEAALRQAHRLESVGQLTSGLALNFNKLLQTIHSSMEILEEQNGLDEDGRACVQIASRSAQRGSILVHRLLAFARQQPLVSEVVVAQQIMTDLALLLTQSLGGRILLETHVEADVGSLKVDAAQLESCLLNMALNARDAMPRGGKLRMRARNAHAVAVQEAGLPPGDYVRFVVEDTGDGMSSETQARMFEPFYTTKAKGEGIGLGLSMVHGFAKQSGGDVRVDRSCPTGTTISLWLPSVCPAGGVVQAPQEMRV